MEMPTAKARAFVVVEQRLDSEIENNNFRMIKKIK
jgi:hypothetical protein